MGLFGTTYLVPVLVQQIAGYSPAQAGNLLVVLLEWRLAAYRGSDPATPAFRDCFLVVTIAFAAAVFPALALRRHLRA